MPDKKRGLILVVEDSKDLQELLTELLQSYGYRVQCADDGANALDWLRASRELPGLILLDYMMPQMDGEQFRKLQLQDNALAAIPVVMVTADGNIQSRAADLRPDAFLRKPFKDVDTIIRVVEQNFRGAAESDAESESIPKRNESRTSTVTKQ